MTTGKPTRGRKDVRIMLSLPPELAAQLSERAKEDATPVSALVRQWVARELRHPRWRHEREAS